MEEAKNEQRCDDELSMHIPLIDDQEEGTQLAKALKLC